MKQIKNSLHFNSTKSSVKMKTNKNQKIFNVS
jgi:hypothetical protein